MLTFRAIFPAVLVLSTAVALAAPPGAIAPPGYLQAGVPDQAEGRAVLAAFRQAGPAKPYYLEFELHQLPRRGQETVYHGRLWADRNAAGSVLRIDLNPGAPGERRYLVQNGAQSEIWASDAGAAPEASPRRIDALEPLVPGVEIAPFDLQMPFLYWPEARLLSITRVRGRPAHLFFFRRPADFAGPPPMDAVRVYLDTQYHAPVRTEMLDREGRLLKTLSLVDLKKVGAEWLPKDIDVRNELTRDKTRFSVTAAALEVDPLPAVFDREGLTKPQLPPPERLISRFAP